MPNTVWREARWLGRRVACELKVARQEVRHGRFQRSMALVSAFAAIVSGFEAYTQHQRGAFANRWMWTPVWLTVPVTGAAAGVLASARLARRALPITAAASLVDGVIGFGLHLRGIGRMPGGLRLGQYNIVMGPPVFAPLLVSIVGVLGLLAAAFRPENLADFRWAPVDCALASRDPGFDLTDAALAPDGGARQGQGLARWLDRVKHTLAQPFAARAVSDVEAVAADVAHGHFQSRMAVLTAFFAALSGGEAYFEHLRGSYNQRWMWTPVWVTPPMIGVALAAAANPKLAQRALPATAAVTFLDGLAGFLLHLRGIRRMPGGLGNIGFNITMGPPLFAPLLFSAVGLLGFIATLLGRGKGH